MNTENLCADKKIISQFIETITCDWSSISEEMGLFEIRCLGENKIPRTKRFSVNEIGAAVDFCARMNAKEFNTYMTINPINMDAKIEPGKAATDHDIRHAHYSFADADDKKGVIGLNNLSNIVDPNFTVITGMIPHERCHHYWRLSEPCTDLRLWAARQKNIAELYETDPCVVNASRVMRVAGTVSYPSKAKKNRGYVAELVTISNSKSEPSIFRIEDWDALIGPVNDLSKEVVKRPNKFDPRAASKDAAMGIGWHNNMLRIVANMVAKGRSDIEILNIAEAHTLHGYTILQTKADIQKMIESARQKGFAKSGKIHQQSAYLFLNNQMYLSKFTRSESVEIRLTNFVAEITSEATITNGIDVTKMFVVEGTLHTGQPLPTFAVEAKAFDKLEWLPTNWGASAQVTVGTKHKEHVTAAIKEKSNPTERTVYSCTGWTEKNNKSHYLTKRGGINAVGLNEEVETELQGSLSNYDLPAPDQSETKSIAITLEYISNLCDDGGALLLAGAAFRAVLSHFKPSLVSVFLQGTTGTYKTAIAACMQSFFGKRFDSSQLPENWSSTGNAMEKKAFLCKDALFTIDDFVACGTPSEVSRLHRKAERVLRAQGNQSGRDRLTSTTEIRGAYVPRGLILATGEDIPNGHSLQARCVILSIKKGATDTDKLTALQELGEKGILAQLMSNYVSWIAEKADCDEIIDLMSSAYADCIKGLPADGHTRMRDNLASLICGMWLFLQFGREHGGISERHVTRFKSATLSAANKVAQLQIIVDREASDTDRFLELLRSSLAMGAAHLATKKGCCPYPLASACGWKVTGAAGNEIPYGQGAKIGWIDGNEILLDMKATLSVIKPLSTRVGNYLGSSERAINKALFEAGMLAKCDEGRHKTKVSVEGRRVPVISLPVSCVMDLEDNEALSEDYAPQKHESPF